MTSRRAEKVVLSATLATPTAPTAPTTPTAPTAPTAPAARMPSPPSESDSPYAPRRQAAAERLPRWRPKENILETAAASGRFETLGQAIQAAGLAGVLSEKGPFTLFAPTDEAFARMPSAERRSVLGDKARLRRVLSYHVVPQKVRAPRKDVPTSATTLDGGELEIAVVAEDGGYRVGDARIVKTNLRASNGVIHVIDTVLMPPASSRSGAGG
jgi:uncharacterized surface protein with fasciclin (FAS1) repeats